MAWSFTIARIFGSEVRIHVTFFLLLLWIGVAHYQHGGNNDIDGRPGHRNGYLLRRFFRHTLKPGKPTDRQQRDVRRSDAITARHQRMAEFMGYDTGKQRQDKNHTRDRRRHAALLIMGDADP